MLRTLLGGAVVAVVAGLLAFGGDTIGITTVWPVLLAVAIGLAAGPALAARTGAAAFGALIGFAAYAVMVGVLPQTDGASALAFVVAVVILTLVAAFSGGLLPLWAGLAGFAAFAGLYDPQAVASPTTFLADAPVALVTILLALGIGALVAVAAELAGATVAGRAAERSHDGHLGAGEVA